MIARTRRKFIAVTMVSAVLVLAVLVGVINWLNFADMNETSDVLLEFLADNGGTFPVAATETSQEIVVTEEIVSGEPSGEPSEEPLAANGDPMAEASGEPSGEATAEESLTVETLPATAEKEAETVPQTTAMPDMMKDRRRGEMIPPRGMDERFTERIVRQVFTFETPYETRYFSVCFEENGELLSIDTSQIAAVTEADAEAMARQLRAAGKTEGYHGNYKYLARDAEEGTLYVFLDCTQDFVSAKRFLSTSMLVSLGGIAVLLLLVVVFSGWAIKPMVTAYDKQKSFITNAGHELKTPLAVIGSCTEVLELEQGENKWTDAIRAQVVRMGDLTQNLIALARLDEGAVLAKAEFDLSAAVKEELEAFRPLAQQKGLGFALDIQENIMLNGNESALRQLAVILADNAVKYATEGEIVFTLSRKGKKVLFQSENPAEGFDAGEQRQLFERFYRGDASHNQENGGYGVGLSIAEAIVNAHGGKISAVSQDGKSLCVTVSL